METLAIVQARMSSTRLPGKVLGPILGKPMILHQLERISRASTLNGIVVATSTDPTDDLLAETVSAAGFEIHRGPLVDVLARYAEVIDIHHPAAIVRLTADCPLISPTIIDLVVEGFLTSGLHYRSNTLTPTFPDGLDVEAVRSSALLRINRESFDAAEREHVTLGIYRSPERFALANVSHHVDYSHHRWTVDTPEDLVFVRWVYEHLYESNPMFDWIDVLQFLDGHPEKARTSGDVRRNVALDGLNTGVMKHKRHFRLETDY